MTPPRPRVDSADSVLQQYRSQMGRESVKTQGELRLPTWSHDLTQCGRLDQVNFLLHA